MNQPSHVRCHCGHLYRVVDGRGLCPECSSTTPPATSTAEPEQPGPRHDAHPAHP